MEQKHVISALVGMGVDNAVIEMDANEPPIGDGSAAGWATAFRSRCKREKRTEGLG